jgi:hypothetical protein
VKAAKMISFQFAIIVINDRIWLDMFRVEIDVR